jgi:hypothetical protein
MTFTIDKKTGFCTEDRDVNIYDSFGKDFYHKRNKGAELRFNLPEGTYKTKNKLWYLDSPVIYSAPRAPKPQKNIPFRNLKVNLKSEYEMNTKARIDTNTGEMDLSDEIFLYPKPIWHKIFFHELGHHLYYTEKYCDHFADLCLLKLGYNPSQLFKGTICSLTPKENNMERILYNYNNGANTRQHH